MLGANPNLHTIININVLGDVNILLLKFYFWTRLYPSCLAFINFNKGGIRMETIYLLLAFIIYYLIATFIFINFLFNPNLELTLVNKKTKEEKRPTNRFLLFYSLFWIIFIPISIYKGE